MPDASYNTVAEVEYGSEEGAAVSSELYLSMRRKYDEYFRVTHDTLGLASTQETQQLKSWIDTIAPTDAKEIGYAEDFYKTTVVKQIDSALNLYHGDFLPPLQRAVSAGIISQASFNEWVAWVRDHNRDYKEKETSILKVLPDYLDARYKLGAKRDSLVKNPRFAKMEQSSDPELKAIAAAVSDTDHFLTTLSFAEREKAIIAALNALPLAEAEVTLFAGFEKDLDAAVSAKLITADSKKKWVARFKDPSVNIRAKEYFVTSQFPSYVAGWKRIQKDRKDVLDDPAFATLTEAVFKHLSTLKSEEKFLALHFDVREGMVAEARAALKAQAEQKTQLHKETLSVLTAAASAGYISASKVGHWAEHVMNGKRTLQELKYFIKDWAKVRYRYDMIEQKMVGSRVPQGMQRVTEATFTNLSYAQRLSYVEEAERRLHIERSAPSNTPLQDKKGKVRHALDTEDWEQAAYFLKQAWPLAQTEEDRAELQSMERHLKAFQKSDNSSDTSEKSKWDTMRSAVEKIDNAINELPAEIKPFYREVLKKGNAGAVRCLGVLFYNVDWCLKRGYLPRDLSKAKDQAQADTERRLQPAGPAHIDGAVEYNDVETYGSAAIPENRWGPNVMCASSSEASKVAESVDKNQNDFAYWYWGDLVVDNVSVEQYEHLGLVTRKLITQGAYALESVGENYHSAKAQLALLN